MCARLCGGTRRLGRRGWGGGGEEGWLGDGEGQQVAFAQDARGGEEVRDGLMDGWTTDVDVCVNG